MATPVVTDDITIKLARLRDADSISNLASKSKIFVYPTWIYCLLIALSCIFVVKRKNKLVGFVIFLYIPWCIAYIMQIAIAKAEQRCRLGSMMIRWTTFYIQEKLEINKMLAHTVKQFVVTWMQTLDFTILWRNQTRFWFLYKRL